MRSHVCVAIRKHHLLQIQEGGETFLLEPYVHGWNDEGAEAVRGVRLPEAGGDPAWVTLAFDSVDHLEPGRRDFLVRRTYDPRAPGLARVHCKLAR